MLVSRALTAFAKIGPPARSELDTVLEAWQSTSGLERGNALEALLRIAPEEGAVRDRFLEALYSADLSVRSSAKRFLGEAAPDIVDWVISDMQSRMAAADRAQRKAIAELLFSLARIPPTIAAELLRSLLEKPGEPCVLPAIRAAARLPRPLPPTLVELTVRLAAGDDEASEHARKLLKPLDADALDALYRSTRLAWLAARRDDPEDQPEEAHENDLPDFPPEQPAPEPLRAIPLPEKLFHALAGVLPAGEKYAGVDDGASPEEIASAVDAAIRLAHREQKVLTSDHVVALGTLWAKAVVQAAGWTWAHVVEGETRWVCLVSKDRAHACTPLEFMREQAQPTRETTVLLLFNMIKTGDLPESMPEQLSFVG